MLWTDGSTLDIHAEMTRLTLTIVARTLFSVDIESSAEKLGAIMKDIVTMFDMLVLPFSDLLQKLPIPAMRRSTDSSTSAGRAAWIKAICYRCC